MMVSELTAIGQLEFGFGFIFCPFRVIYEPPLARWKCGNPALLFLAGFPSPVERVENSLCFLSFPRFPRGGISTALFTS